MYETVADGTLTSYYVNDLTRSQSQGGITNTYSLDASLRQRERVTTGGAEEGTEIYHYASGSDSPAWTEEIGEGEPTWTRNISALGGGLGAIQTSSGEVTLQLTDLHGDVVATADDDPEATKLLDTQRFDEFGNPTQSGFLEGGNAEYGWLGGKTRRTQLPSGVIQMGVRSYVPAIGRFISTDPVLGGSANAYDYANANPVTGFDLEGKAAGSACSLSLGRPHASKHKPGRVNAVMRIRCHGDLPITGWVKTRLFYSPTRNGRAHLVGSGKKTFDGANFTKKASASAVCKPGWYAAVGGAFGVYPPGSIPPYRGGVYSTRRYYVSCR